MKKIKVKSEQKGRVFSNNIGMVKVCMLILILLSIIFIAFAVTETISSFVEQDNPFNVTFAGNENHTYYIDIPMHAYVENITIEITGLEAE